MIFGWGGNGFGGRNFDGNPVTEAGLCNAMNFNDLANSVGRGFDQQSQFAMQGMRDLCQSSSALSSQIDQVRFDNQACCCETQRAIDGVNYNGAINTAAITAAVGEGTQKVLDAITGNRMADMQNQINQLQLNAALCGVVRYPNSITYGAGTSPFCNSCGCAANI